MKFKAFGNKIKDKIMTNLQGNAIQPTRLIIYKVLNENKSKILTEIKKQGSTELRLNFENQDYKMMGLPFYNEGVTNNNLRKEVEEKFNKK